jgi:hypothetical protein
MAKFNGSGIRTTQNAAPKASETSLELMRGSFDPAVVRASQEVMSDSVIDNGTAAPQGGFAQSPMAPTTPMPVGPSNAEGPVYEEGYGMTPQGQVQPLSARMQQSRAGTLNTQPSTTTIPSSPIHKNAPDPSSASNIIGRADTLAKNLSMPGRNNLGINMHPQTANKPALQPSFEARGTGVAQDTLSAAQKPLLSGEGQANNLPVALHQKLKVLNYNLNGEYNMKPEFAKLISVTTENAIYNASMAIPDLDNDINPNEPTNTKDWTFDADGKRVYEPVLINPVEQVSRLGREIEKQVSNLHEQEGGERPVPMTEAEARDVGAMAMQAYQMTNPDIVEVVPNPDEVEGGVRYSLIGLAELDKSAGMMAEMFDVQVPPLHNAPATLNPSIDKPLIRGGEKTIKNERIGMDMLEESMENQAGVAHVVDRRKLRIAAAMVIPTLFRTPGAPNDMWGSVFGVGGSKVKTLIAREMVLNNRTQEEAAKVAKQIISSKKKDMMKEINALVMNYGQPNYLTYNIQKLSTRASPTQSQFNYTRNKIVRFATRGATPTLVIAGKKDRAYRNMVQVFALNLLKDDMLLDDQRLIEMEFQSKRFSDWGKQLKELLDKAFPDNMFDAMVQAMENNVPLDHPSFPKPNFRVLGEGIGVELKRYLDSKGEDSMNAIDAMIEWNRFVETKDGATFSTHVQAWADGKNNGVANGGNMIGSRPLAFLTGVLRDPKTVFALNTQTMGDTEKVIDVAMEMRNIAVESMTQNGIFVPEKLSNVKSELTQLAVIAANHRDLNKAISMIFPYGKELSSMKTEVSDELLVLVGSNPEFEVMYNDAIENKKFTHADLVDVVHHNVTSAVTEIFGNDTFIARGMMRNSSYLMAAMDKSLSITSPSGSQMHLGGSKQDLSKAETSKVSVKDNAGGQPNSTLNVQTAPTYQSSAAAKGGRISAKGFGRALVMPVHAIDAHAMHMTFSGNSWSKIKARYGKGEPYVRQVYDAISVDATNYDVVMEEINNNWKNLTLNGWDYFKEMRDSVRTAYDQINKELRSDMNASWTLQPGTKFDFIGALLTPEVRLDGSQNHATLKSFIRTTMPPLGNIEAKDYASDVKEVSQNLLDKISYTIGVDMGQVDGTRSVELPPINSQKVLDVINLLFKENDYFASSATTIAQFKAQRRKLYQEVENLRSATGTGSRQYHGH